MKIILVPKLTNPMTCRFFEPRYAFDLGVLTIGSFVKDRANVSIKSIFGLLGKKYLNLSDIQKLSGKSFLVDFADYILAESPDMIGISTIDSSLVNTIVLLKAIMDRGTDARIILGGPGVFFNYADIMESYPFIDFCIRGEGEVAFEKFIRYLHGEVKTEEVPGLVFRQNGNLCDNNLANMVDVDTLPFLSYDLYDTHPRTLKSISSEPGRGCPFKCTFCTTTAFWNNRHRVKSPKRLAKEVAHYCGLYSGITHFDFHSHDNFLKSKKYIAEINDEFKKRNLNITWNCSSRIDLLDDEFIDLLVKSGCSYIDCGIESGSERIRQLIKKNIDIERTLINAKKLLTNNIGIATNFMFGFPTETLKEMEETFEMACRCVNMGTDIVFCYLSPLKGTEIYSQFPDLLVKKAGDHLHDFTDNSVNFFYDSEETRIENNYFSNQTMMFSNDYQYNRIVEKIRDVDSVYLFSFYSGIFLKIKETFGSNIYECKAALKEFPYSEDFLDFIEKQAIEYHLDLKVFIQLILEILDMQVKKNLDSRTEVDDITWFIGAHSLLGRIEDSGYRKERAFIDESIHAFFERNLGLNLHKLFKSVDGIDLVMSYYVKSRSELFLKFKNETLKTTIPMGIKFSKDRTGKLLYYKKNFSIEELKLLNTISTIITAEFNVHKEPIHAERIGA